MKNTLILATSHRGLSDETYECIMATECPNVLKVKGIACVDRARCIAFDRALAALALPQATDIDMVLAVDDDMVFSAVDAQRLCDAARLARHPTSARYCTRSGATAGTKLEPGKNGAPLTAIQERWAFGLGFMAIPRVSLERVAPTLPRVAELRMWAQNGAHPLWPGKWISEDIWFCTHFGGVELAPIDVGHLKTVVLYPGRTETAPRVMMLGEKV